MYPEFQLRLRQECKLTSSLNCISRLSARLLDDIYDFLKNIHSASVFFEWVWVTVANTKGYDVVDFGKPNEYTYRPIRPDFNDYKLGYAYHAIKLGINWGAVLGKGGIIESI